VLGDSRGRQLGFGGQMHVFVGGQREEWNADSDSEFGQEGGYV